jgi:hypothetical protein
MKILHIGSFTSQHTLVAGFAYEYLGCDVIFINTQKGTSISKVKGLSSDFLFINPYLQNKRTGASSISTQLTSLKRYFGLFDNNVYGQLVDIATNNHIDLIVGTWGYSVLEVSLVAKKVFPNVKYIHNVLTIPDLPVESCGLRGYMWRIFDRVFGIFQDRAYRSLMQNTQIRVFATEAMFGYVNSKYGPFMNGQNVIRIEHFNKCFFPKKRLEKLSSSNNEPHIAHIGATNFAVGMEIDDVSDSLIKISKEKINIHLNTSVFPESLISADKEYLHFFDSFSNEFEHHLFAEFLTQFDAIIILYNVKKVYERFEYSLPTRFLFALIVGVPIFLPKGLFPACERYILQNQIGFAYLSEKEMYLKLRDPLTMNLLSNNSLAHSANLDFEANSNFFNKIFMELNKTKN